MCRGQGPAVSAVDRGSLRYKVTTGDTQGTQGPLPLSSLVILITYSPSSPVFRSAMLSTASWTTGPHNWLEGARVQPRDRGQGSFANLSPR